MASEGTTHGCFVFGGVDALTGEPYGGFDFSYVGYGGRDFADGNDTTDSINGNCANTPMEVFETRFPWIVEEYALRPDSGGPGRHRGGLSNVKTMLCTGPMLASQMTNKHKLPAWGLLGGQAGLCGATLFQAAGSERWQTIAEAFGKVSPSKYSNVPLRPGDRVRVMAPGGGGFGSPSERTREDLSEDVREGFVSEATARAAYPGVLDGGSQPLRRAS
jgi:N-methylhydantoinase B/oxoprolinase/acetone carboxylase alpha subunit